MANSSATEKLGVDLEVDGWAELLDLMRAVAKQAPVTGRPLRKMLGGGRSSGSGTAIVAQPGQPTQVPLTPGNLTVIVQVANIGGGGGNMSPSGSRGMSRRRPGAYGLAQRHRDLLADVQDPTVRADHARYQDTLKALKRTESQLIGGTPKGKVMQAIMSTRINAGNASPLVGRSMQALEAVGVSMELLGPIALVVGALGLAATGLYNLANQAAELGNAFTRMQISTGGNTQTTAQLQTIGSAIGLSDDQVSSIARTVQDRITSDPMARAAGMRLGVFNLPGMFGSQDYGKQLTTVINNLRQISDPTERLALARQIGGEDLARTAMLSNKQYAYTQSDSAVRSSVMTPELLQDAADFQAALGRVGEAFDNIMASLGPVVIPVVTQFLNELADELQILAKWIVANQDTIHQFFDMLISAAESLGGVTGHLLLDTGSNNDALNANTAAVKEHTAATKMLIPGTYGTMTRNGGMPSGVNGQSIDAYQLGLSAF